MAEITRRSNPVYKTLNKPLTIMGVERIKASIADSIHLLVHIERHHARRYINEILAIRSYSPNDDAYHLETVFNCSQENSAQESKQ